MNRIIHRAWQVSAAATIFTGLFHLINLAGPSRGIFGPAMITPFRLAFLVSWIFLAATLIVERRRPRLGRVDLAVAFFALLYLVRAMFVPETFTTSLNWVLTGTGVFYLIRHGVRDRRDLRLMITWVALTVLAAAAAGIGEYALKWNPLFESIQIDAIGMDQRVEASNQLYRIRTVIGHPGFVGAIVTAAVPLIALSFWRRRFLLAASLLVLGTALLLTFSRGSWLLASVFLLPLLAWRGRFWLRRHVLWLAPLALLPSVFLVIDYLGREEVSAQLGSDLVENGLVWTKGKDGPYYVVSGEAAGATPYNRFFYFQVDDAFFFEDSEAVTVVVHFFDKGTGAIHVEYDSWNVAGGREEGAYTTSGYVNKTDSHTWTTAAFYLEQPRFAGRQNAGADLRVVDDDNLIIVDEVTLQKGKLKLLSVIAQQWRSRAGSVDTRLDLYPFAWNVLGQNSLGVGPFNTPGTDHHAVDSWPLTWMMEFGWIGLLMTAAVLALFVREGLLVFRKGSRPAAALYLCLALLILHGIHLMILYDKPSLVLLATVAAIYSIVRPGGDDAYAELRSDEFML